MFIYNLVVLLYGFVIRTAAISNAKAKLWFNGRKNWRVQLQKKILPIANEKKVWIHCASLGEFEQGRPIMEAIKKQHSNYKIILTFFSPSGYEVRKDYKGADVVCYLPLDTRKNARDFIGIIKPNLVLFIKYEFWVNFLNEIKLQNITCYLISAVFKDHHPFFKWYGQLFVKSLNAFKVLFVQDAHSKDLLNGIGVKNIEICGDTRFDRVLEIKTRAKLINELNDFKGESKLIIAGSTWPDDEQLVINAYKLLDDSNIKLVIAPHEIDEKSIQQTKDLLVANNLSFSLFTEGINANHSVLILNTMGMLSQSYFYADLVYIGGGFNDGIHNILEPAVYHIPVSFYGSDFVKYNEATDLVKIKAAFNVLNEHELVAIWQTFLQNKTELEQLQMNLDAYFVRNSGVTDKVMKAMEFS